jgi:hypothetical protein
MLTLINKKSWVTGSFNIEYMFTFVKKRRLKKKIFNEFEKAQKEKNYKMIDILGKRYLKIK